MDDTLTNTKEMQIILWKKYVENNPNDEFSTVLPNNINSFGIRYIDEFWDTYREQLSFESSFKDNVSDILHKLLNDGHELSILSSRPDNKYKNLKERMMTQFKEYDIPIKTIYTNVQDKGLFLEELGIDMLIDDIVEHCLNALKHNKKAILFNSDINYDGIQTTDWIEVYQLIKESRD